MSTENTPNPTGSTPKDLKDSPVESKSEDLYPARVYDPEISTPAPLDVGEDDASQWTIQTWSVILIAVVGLIILAIFLVSLWLGKHNVRKMLKTPPSRMRAIWENVHVIPFKPGLLFRRSSQSRGISRNNSKDWDNLPSDERPIHTDHAHPERECSGHYHNIGDDIIQADPESSEMAYEDARVDMSSEASCSSSCVSEPVTHHMVRSNTLSSSGEDYLLYKVITI